MEGIATARALMTNGTICTVQLLKAPTDDDKAFCRLCALGTIGKDSTKVPDEKWLHDICKARHSPIRELRFAFKLVDVPYFVSTHLARHIHAQPYIQSQRNDRQSKYDRRKAPQDAPVTMIWTMNAEELMTVCNKRLCMKADTDTRACVNAIRMVSLTQAPYLADLLVPMCVYLGNKCPEMHGCGRWERKNEEVETKEEQNGPDI